MAKGEQGQAAATRVPLITIRGTLKHEPQEDTWKDRVSYNHMVVDESDFFDDRVIVNSPEPLTQEDFNVGVSVRYIGEFRNVHKFAVKK